jgi:UDP-glucose 4-epimerase
MATYGVGNPPFKETDVRIPKDPYGIAKLAVEMDLHEAYEHFGLKYCSVLPHNVISPFQNYYDRYRNAIAIWIRQCLIGQDITIFGDGLQKRAFSDCNYLCQPIERLLHEYEDEFFNVGSDHEMTIKEAAETVLTVGKKLGFDKSKIVHLQGRKEVKFAYSDHTKAKEKLGYKDETDLEMCIEQMFRYAMTLELSEMTKITYEVTKNLYEFYK